jgi:hypothetical protein
LAGVLSLVLPPPQQLAAAAAATTIMTSLQVCEGRSQGEGTREESMLVLFSEVLMVGIYYYTLLKLVKKIWQRSACRHLVTLH